MAAPFDAGMNLKELSEHLGLSQTTVSRALGGYPEVKESTRARVNAAATKFNYRPSRSATTLATGRAMAIGHVIPLSANHEMVNPIFSDFIAGAGEAYQQAGYDILMSVVSDTDEMRAYREFAIKGAVDGVVIYTPRRNDPRIRLLQEIGLPFVVHGQDHENQSDYSFVDINNGFAFQRGAEYLLSLGHTRIGLINGIETLDFAASRRAGVEKALSAAGITPDPQLMFNDEMTERSGYHAMRAMLAEPDPPTAVLTSSIVIGLGAQRAIHDAGLEMGREISVLTHDDVLSYMRNGGEVPLFTATRSAVRPAGTRCAEILLSLIENPTQPPVQETWECELVVGTSTGPCP